MIPRANLILAIFPSVGIHIFICSFILSSKSWMEYEDFVGSEAFNFYSNELLYTTQGGKES